MMTGFGRFVMGKFFPKLFLAVYIFLTVLVTGETGAAVLEITGSEAAGWAAMILMASMAVIVITQKSLFRRWDYELYKKISGFISCFMIYDVIPAALWSLIALLLRTGKTVKAQGILLLSGISFLIVLYGYLHTKVIKTKVYRIRLGEGQKRYRIALVSDIHLGAFVGEKHIRRLVKKINELNPDVAVIAGDLIDVDNAILNNPEKMKRLGAVLRDIHTAEGVFLVLGNHDPKLSNQTFVNFIDMCGFRLLDNCCVRLSEINLAGRTDKTVNVRLPMEAAARKEDPSKPLVVLDHDPQGIREAAAAGADLVLCGHTHRGQFFPVTIFTKWANGRHFFYGYERFGKTQAVISSGAGFFGLPVRIGTSNEVVDIEAEV